MAKVVASGESVVLFVNSSKYLFAVVDAKKRIQVGKQNIVATELEGKQYGATYTIDRGTLTQIKANELLQLKSELAPEAEQVPDANNSLLVDDNTSQKLTQADIAEMKSQGATGKDVIKAIVGSSSTFHTKTEYSKEKYLKKKSQKHITTVQILRGTTNTIWTAYYYKSPEKVSLFLLPSLLPASLSPSSFLNAGIYLLDFTTICNIRGDSLALMLNLSNVFAHPDILLVVENCQGLIVGAVAERMGGLGKVYFGNLEPAQPSTTAVKSFNFSKQVEDSIITFPVPLLVSLLSPPSAQPQEIEKDTTTTADKTTQKGKAPDNEPKDKEMAEAEKEAKRIRTLEETQALARDGADSLLVVSKYAPQSIVPQLVRALKGGAAFAVFAQQLQPLVETHELLRNSGMAINMNIAETWLRVHQVLPARTHPHMQMDGASGFILNGVRVIQDNFEKVKGTKRKNSETSEPQPEQKVTKTD